jgi:hypothetical protein
LMVDPELQILNDSSRIRKKNLIKYIQGLKM